MALLHANWAEAFKIKNKLREIQENKNETELKKKSKSIIEHAKYCTEDSHAEQISEETYCKVIPTTSLSAWQF